jgi:hypothetical protein
MSSTCKGHTSRVMFSKRAKNLQYDSTTTYVHTTRNINFSLVSKGVDL